MGLALRLESVGPGMFSSEREIGFRVALVAVVGGEEVAATRYDMVDGSFIVDGALRVEILERGELCSLVRYCSAWGQGHTTATVFTADLVVAKDS